MSDFKDNATFLTFKEGGKYYTSVRHYLPDDFFRKGYSRPEFLGKILMENNGQFPGLSGPGNDFYRVVIPDEDHAVGFPMMFPIGMEGIDGD